MRMDKLTHSWPFRPDEVLPVDLAAVPPFVAQTAESILNGAEWLQATTSLASQFAASGDAHDARLSYRAAAAAYPFLATVWSGWGDFELAQATTGGQPGRLAEAVRLYERALAAEPDSPQASMMLGAVRLQAGDAAAAVPYLERATAGVGAPPQALYNPRRRVREPGPLGGRRARGDAPRRRQPGQRVVPAVRRGGPPPDAQAGRVAVHSEAVRRECDLHDRPPHLDFGLLGSAAGGSVHHGLCDQTEPRCYCPPPSLPSW